MDGAGDANKCCDLLRQAQIPTVRGNHDAWFSRDYGREMPHATRAADVSGLNRAWLENLPSTLRFETSRGALLLCHGLGENNMASVKNDDYGYALEANFELQNLIERREFPFILNGHTHQTMAKRFGALAMLNPGALSRAGGGSLAVFDFSAGLAQWQGFADGEICSRATLQF